MIIFRHRPGVALFLVMSVIFVTLTTILIGATVILHNLDSSQTVRARAQAEAAASAGLERVLAAYKAGSDLEIVSGCSASDCIDIENLNCTSCTSAAATYTSDDMRFSIQITDISETYAKLTATGWSGSFKATKTATVDLGFACGDEIEDRDGYTYGTVEIGEQCWMSQSLRTKTKLDGTCINTGGVPPCDDASAADDDLGRSCYDNDENRCVDYGALYRWGAAMSDSVTEGGQGLCPDGWHVPTDSEWHELETQLTGDENTCDPERTGDTEDCDPAGVALAEGGGAGFNDSRGGHRHKASTFEERGNKGMFWTSSTDGTHPFMRLLSNGSDLVARGTRDNNYSVSLRCLKN